MKNLSLMILLVLGNACVSDDANIASPTTCEEASILIQDCVQAASDGNALPADCEVLVNQASTMCPSGKADWWGDWMCRVGVLRYCAEPTCDATPSPNVNACTDYIGTDGCGSCDYYLCKESAADPRSCGDAGYYVGFGYKYCRRLTQVTGPRMSPAGQAWVAKTRECLMHAIERDVTSSDSCPDIKRLAFDSHAACYIDSGFCSLPISDIWSVVTTIDPADFELRQMVVTGIGCIADLFL